jgi:hypothetical protein
MSSSNRAVNAEETESAKSQAAGPITHAVAPSEGGVEAKNTETPPPASRGRPKIAGILAQLR